MFFTSNDNKTENPHQQTKNSNLSGKNSWKHSFKSNKENLVPMNSKRDFKAKKSWFEEESPPKGQSKDSLFVDSDIDAPKQDFLKLGNGDFDLKNLPLRNLFNLSELSAEKSPLKFKSESEKMTISKVSSKASNSYLQNTREFVKNCFESISNRKSENFSKEDRGGVSESTTNLDLSFLLQKYNKNVSNFLKKRISKSGSRKRLTERIKSFLRRHPQLKKSLLDSFRQSVETLPQLLHIFKPESQPKLQQMQENISINQLSNLPRRNYQSKNLKSTIQLFCFKYYFFKMKKKPLQKTKYVSKLQKLTKMSGRQIYKWVWDEEKRFQEMAKTCSIRELHKREQSIFTSWKRIKESFRRKVKDRNLWIVSRIILKSVGFFSEKIEKKIWNVKLKGLLQKSIFMDLSF